MRILAPISRSALLVVALSVAAVSVTGCIPTPAPQPAPPIRVPPPAPRPEPAPPPASSDWRDWPITPGTWSLRQDGRGSTALFGAVGRGADLTIRCDKGANAIYLSRAGDARGTGFTIRTSTVTRALPTQPTGATPPAIAAMLAPDDRLLDAIGFSRGRFVVEAPPLQTLVIPAWPEILRVVEDCRS